MADVCYRLADLVLRIQTDPGFDISERERSFWVSETKPDLTFRFHVLDPDTLPADQAAQAEIDEISRRIRCFNGHWNSPFLRAAPVRALLAAAMADPGDIALEALDSSLRVLDFGRNTQDIFHPAALQPDTLFSRLGEHYLAPFLSGFQAVILHSAAVIRKRRAAVFVGPDGAGKTTVATSPQAGTILCDDQVILRRRDGRFRAYGTPWGRLFDAVCRAPVGGLFLLRQADTFSLTRLDATVPLNYIWNEFAAYHLPLPAPRRARAFEFVCDLCRSLPAYLMRFGENQLDWPAIDGVLAESSPGSSSI